MEKLKIKNSEDIERAILEAKAEGMSDYEIGQKYNVNFKYIEKVVVSSQGVNISSFNLKKKIKTFQPKNFQEEKSTVWSYKQRGNWATHSGEYRGNWSPYIPRNIIIKYSKPDEIVLDFFCGGGTTAVECKLLGRRCIGVDINDKAIELAKKNIIFDLKTKQLSFFQEEKDYPVYEPEFIVGDARDLSFICDESIDLICSHPPYANIIKYTDNKYGDLSNLDIDSFLIEMEKVAKESFRVLKPGRHCAILIGDTRKNKKIIPLGFKVIDLFLKAGFKLKELIIKIQHNCKTTGFWYDNSIKYNFLLLAHEYLPVFEKSIEDLEMKKENEAETKNNNKIHLQNLNFQRKKLNKLETTTVWILPEEHFDSFLIENAIRRYSDNNSYSVINLSDNGDYDIEFEKSLVYIKSLIIDENPSKYKIEDLISSLNEIVRKLLDRIKLGGFLIIQCNDIRANGYIVPMAKRIYEEIIFKELALKEIIVATKDNSKTQDVTKNNCLKITHQYLLVFEKIVK